MDRRYQVFLSSTFEDLQEERQLALQALLSIDCIPSGMELFPASDNDQWTLIKNIIKDCDYFILILAGRYGSTDKGGLAYTEKEYDFALKNKIPVIAFLHEDIAKIPLGKSEKDPAIREKLNRFREKAKQKMVQTWSSPQDLAAKIPISLSKLIQSHPASGWIRNKGDFGAVTPEGMAPLLDRIKELERILRLSKTARAEEVGESEALAFGDFQWDLRFVEERPFATIYFAADSPEHRYAEYFFNLSIFNNGSKSIGVHNVTVEFYERDQLLFVHRPAPRTADHTWSTGLLSRPVISVPPGQWVSERVGGIVQHADYQKLAKCNLVHMNAETTDGLKIRKIIATIIHTN